MINLKKITMHNFIDIINLPLSDQDKKLVAPNIFSLAEAYADGVSVAKGIYDDDLLVGFIMYDYNQQEQKGYISRLMITSPKQGLGYGTKALKLVVDELMQIKELKTIQISYHENNQKARKSYKKVGFIETNEYVDGEIIARINIDKNV